jgi:hypothetical protein
MRSTQNIKKILFNSRKSPQDCGKISAGLYWSHVCRSMCKLFRFQTGSLFTVVKTALSFKCGDDDDDDVHPSQYANVSYVINHKIEQSIRSYVSKKKIFSFLQASFSLKIITTSFIICILRGL